VALVGGTGKLGGIIRAVIDAEPGFEIAAVLGSRSDLAEMDAADLVVDASTPGVSIDVVRAAIERGLNVLVGTSGWSVERIALVRPRRGRGTGAVFIPNFSRLGHRDRPRRSGVAPVPVDRDHRGAPRDEGRFAERHRRAHGGTHRRSPGWRRAVEAPHIDQRARGQQVASVPIHSLRGPVSSLDETILSGPGESITIVHDTIDPARRTPPASASPSLPPVMRAA
jgi:4-hydroxy-tetrahydrodipicolinate reductase